MKDRNHTHKTSGSNIIESKVKSVRKPVKGKWMRKALAGLLTVAMMASTVAPGMLYNEAYAAESEPYSRVADDTTLDGWKKFFGESDNKFDTEYSGHVWTDKSVTTDASKFSYAEELADGSSTIQMKTNDKNNFLVALSAMASSKSVTGQDNKPTDTMIVLDLSSSMYPGRSTGTVSTMLTSVNNIIKQLQELNVNNRVGVTIYYGGTDRNQSTAPSYTLLLPLDRYTRSGDSNFLTYTTNTENSSTLDSVKVNSNVKNSQNQTVAETTRVVTTVAGTYTQQGILSALNQFLSVDTVVPENAAVNAGEQRTPVMVLMSDGEPTAATSDYTNLNANAGMGNNTVSIRNAPETDFVTQLTASYAKEMMDAHYEEEPLFYTLSLGSQISYDVMDPSDTLDKNFTPSATISGYWDSLLANNSVAISVMNSKDGWSKPTVSKTYTVAKSSITGKTLSKSVVFPSVKSQQKYVDKAFEATTANDLANAFANIFKDIELQTHTYPTLVEDDENLDGYVSFVDKIGKCMNVTDVKGVLMGEHWYSGRELAKNFVTGGGSLGTTENPKPLGDELVWSLQKRMGLTGENATSTVRALLGRAYEYGQIYYDSTTGKFSNYIGWYSDQNDKFVGFWHGGDVSGLTEAQVRDISATPPAGAAYKNKSYLYLGETDELHDVANSDMMYTTVRVRENIATGEQSVNFAVPAALIPTVEYDIELDENDALESVVRSGADHPIRLVYEVALDESVNEFTLKDVVDETYLGANKNSDGSVNFYTNQYEKDKSEGYGKVNTYSYFRPSHQNENYYYQEDAVIYKDTSGNEYKSSSKPDLNGTYYRKITVYSKNGSTIKAETNYKKISSSILETAVSSNKNPGTWYIPKEHVYMNMGDYTILKADKTLTGTLDKVNSPYVDVHGHSINDVNHRFVIGDTLGNNGKLTLKPVTGIKITKLVEDVSSASVLTNELFDFEVAVADANNSYDALKVKADGTQESGTVTFAGGKATVSLKVGESIYISGFSTDKTVTVSEQEEKDFVVSEITVNETKADGTTIQTTTAQTTTAKTTTVGNAIQEIQFTNVPRGEGILTIAKIVEHPFGADYIVPDSLEFDVTVKFEGIAIDGTNTFNVKRSGHAEENKTLENNSLTLKIKHGEQIEIFGIPEGTKATVVEGLSNNSPFSVSYKENHEDGDGVIESILKAPTIDTVTVVNKYSPSNATVKLDLSGTKTLVGEWDEDLEFTFFLQEYDREVEKWETIATTTIASGSNASSGAGVASSSNAKIDWEELELEFDEVGTYAYQIIEKNHGRTIEGITYDATMHTFDIIVTDKDMDGKLEASVESSHLNSNHENESAFELIGGIWTNDHINFVNHNNRGETSEVIMIQKHLQNESGSNEVSLEGHRFEVFKTDENYESNRGLVTTSVQTDAAGETYVQLLFKYEDIGTHYYKLKEKATGKTSMIDSKEEYHFQIEVATESNASGEIYSSLSGKTGDTFKSFKEDGSTFEYKLANFTNVYSPSNATVNLNVWKKLKNRTLKNDEFTFELKGNSEVRTASNAAPAAGSDLGKVDFGELTFDKVGTYEYTVQEVSEGGDGVVTDKTIYEVIINVYDNNGQLEAEVTVLNVVGETMIFDNVYTPAPIKTGIPGQKNLEGRPLVGGQFTFTLAESDVNGNLKEGGYHQSVTNETDGTFAFDEISYDQVGSYYYVISEKEPENKQGITYDSRKFLTEVTIGYDMDLGVFTASNATKVLNGDGSKVNLEFKNIYKASPTNATIPGFKALDGRVLEDEQFEFNLYESDSSWTKGNKLQTEKNAADGTFSFAFEEGYFTEAGKYYYLIDETKGNAIGYLYDSKLVGVIVDVTDDYMGHLHAELSYVDIVTETDATGVVSTEVSEATGVRFFNNYEKAEAIIDGTKILLSAAGKELSLKGDEFRFKLTAKDNAPLPEDTVVTNDEDGYFVFDPMYYDVVGVYEYQVREINEGQENIIYDDSVYDVIVTIGVKDGMFVVENMKIKLGSKSVEEIVFENKYIGSEDPEDPWDPDDPWNPDKPEKPTKPAQPKNPTTPGTPEGGNGSPGAGDPSAESEDVWNGILNVLPMTGDNIVIWPYIAVLMAALIGIVVLIKGRRKNKDEK